MKKSMTGRVFAAIVVMLAVMMGVSACKVKFNDKGDMTGDIAYSPDELKARAFDKIMVEVPCDVYYTQNDGNKSSVVFDYSGIKDPEIVSDLKQKIKVVYRKNGTVELGVKGHIRGYGNKGRGSRLKVYVSSPDLISVTNEGVGNFYAKSINSDKLTIANEGVGSVNIDNILANAISIDNEGVGHIKVVGAKGDGLSVINEGVGSVHVDNYVGGKVVLDNEGVGSIHATVNSQSVKAMNDGVGSIHLSGKTHVLTTDNDGVGKINTSDLERY